MRVGIVGCGRIATLRLNLLKRITNVDVLAAVDPNKKALYETLEKFQIEKGFDDYRIMLEKADVDAVFVCTPPEEHFKIVMDSIKHNKHVFCEKPIATTFKDALTIKKTLEKRLKNSNSIVLMPGHNFIFTPSFVEALKYVKHQEIGKLKKIVGCATSNLTFYKANTDFRVRAKGGVVEDLLPHVIYLCHEAGGFLEKIVSIETRRTGYAVIDDVNVKIELSNGVQASLSARWSGLIPTLKFDLIGDSGQIKMDLLRTPYNITVVRERARRTKHMGRRIRQFFDVLQNKHPSYMLEVKHFIKCIEGAEEARVTVHDGVEMARTLSKVMSVFDKSPCSPVGRRRVVILKVGESVEKAIHKSLRLLGGLDVKRNQQVIIKPNVCYPKNVDDMIITDSRVLEKIIDLVKKRTDNILVVESDSISGTAEKRMKQSGMMNVIKKHGVDFLNLSKDDVEEHTVAGHVLEIPKTLLKADFVINVPKLKTNDFVSISIAMKNMFGVLANKKKHKFHKNLTEILVYLNRILRQDLVIVDGIVGMEGLGPIRGSPVKLGLLISGLDAITVDAVCCQIMEINPYAVESLWTAYKNGFGEIDVKRIHVLGETIDNVKTKFSLPSRTPKNIFSALKTSLKFYLRE